MDVRIDPRPLSGTVTPPPSKSMTHRLLLAAALADGVSTVRNVALSRDIEATLRCLRSLGAAWETAEPGVLTVRGIGGAERRTDGLPVFDCGESGSTLRFLIPIALAAAGGGVFLGRGRLMERPQQPYRDLFREKGILWEQDGGRLTVRGTLTPGEYRLPGNVSSQFFTGLLFALPMLDGESAIVSTTAVESRDYLLMTLDALKTAGVAAESSGDGRRFSVRPAACRPFDAAVEADWSQAAFWYAAAFADNRVVPAGLNPDSVQGDRRVAILYWRLARPGDAEINVSDCPDLLPPLAVMAAVRRGNTRFINAGRLRDKESDRLQTTAALLCALGACARETSDGLLVCGGRPLSGGAADGAGDHRIVMAAAVAATVCAGPVTVSGADAVDKSYPAFWDDYKKLGGSIHVL